MPEEETNRAAIEMIRRMNKSLRMIVYDVHMVASIQQIPFMVESQKTLKKSNNSPKLACVEVSKMLIIRMYIHPRFGTILRPTFKNPFILRAIFIYSLSSLKCSNEKNPEFAYSIEYFNDIFRQSRTFLVNMTSSFKVSCYSNRSWSCYLKFAHVSKPTPSLSLHKAASLLGFFSSI